MTLPFSNKKNILCTHFGVCSGCSLNTSVDSPEALEEACRFFLERGLSDFFLHADNPTGWRCRAKLAVRGTSDQPLIGLYKEGTHEVVAIPFCKVHHSGINQAVQQIKAWIKAEEIIPYNEITGFGELRYLQLVVERATGKIQLSLVINSNESTGWLEGRRKLSLEKLCASNEDFLWHSLWLNFNTNRTNVIFGKEWKLFFGAPLLWETLGGVQICFQPSSFAQANLDLFEKMLKQIVAHVPQNSSVAEFYSGVGVIGLSLAEKCRQVVCCEVNSYSRECFEMSRERLDPDVANKISFHVGKASEFAELITSSEIVLVDPPRRGLDQPVLNALKGVKGPKQLFYVSCGWLAFQRDCDSLMESGWKLTNAEGYLFFPGSNYIEILAIFQK